MVLPIGDAPNPRGAPWVTYLLIAANVAVFVFLTVPLAAVQADPSSPGFGEYVEVMSRAIRDPAVFQRALANLSAYDLFVFDHGFRPAAPSFSDLFSSMFLHAGFAHLAGNMLFLWIYGDNVEHRFGAGPYLLAYLATGAAAALFQAVFSPDSEIPMVGASGAISGVLGFYFLWFPRNQVRLLWLLPPFLMDVFLVPARLVLGLYLVADNLLPFLAGGSVGGVAHGAHIGGFVAGLAGAWLLGRRALAAEPHGYARAAAGEAPDPGDVAAAIRDGRVGEAATEYFALSPAATRGLLSPDDSLALARWLRANGHADAALVVLRRHLRDFPRGPGRAEAHVAAGEILLEDQDEPTPAYQHFVAALDLDPPPALGAAARAGVAAIAAMQKRQIGQPHARRGR
jgi:membrane associated rhomboid family serine protease